MYCKGLSKVHLAVGILVISDDSTQLCITVLLIFRAILCAPKFGVLVKVDGQG